MTIQELFIRSNQALGNAVSQITKEQWEMPLPPATSSRPTNLIQAVRYHTYDDAWVPDVMAGKTKDDVGETYEHLLTNDDVQVNYSTYNQRANEAVASFGNLDLITHLSYGDFSARDYLQHIISFRAFRSYDIAKMIGANTAMDDDLVDALLKEFSPVAEMYRQMGVFPSAAPVSSDASPQQKLLAMIGRS